VCRPLRNQLIQVALAWQNRYGVAPHVTTAISELDAADLVGMSESEYSESRQLATAVQRGYDFTFRGERYQVKANRPSGRRGSKVSLVSRPRNYDWNYLIWLLYDREYKIQEAWKWPVEVFKKEFDGRKRLSPADLQKGTRMQLPGDA
jgi:hypothetical protein